MISIIVPIYNVEAYLCQCIESILNQTYSDIEVLLIDDGSPDKCGAICDNYAMYDSRIRVYHIENQGLSVARNIGIKNAMGRYISFIDADDWIEPDMYESLLNQMEATCADVGVCGLWHEYPKHSIASYLPETVYNGNEILEALIDDKINTGVWNKLYLKELFETISFPAGKIYEDTATIHRVFAKSKRVRILAAPKYHYRQRDDSISKTHSARNLIECANACMERYNYYFYEKPDIYEKKQEAILRYTIMGIDRLWRWWYRCSVDEKKEYIYQVHQFKEFSRKNVPLFGYSSWPLHLKISSVFLYTDSWLSFATLYYLNISIRNLSLYINRLLNNIKG